MSTTKLYIYGLTYKNAKLFHALIIKFCKDLIIALCMCWLITVYCLMSTVYGKSLEWEKIGKYSK